MDVFWPGAVIGPVLVVLCLVGIRKREALAEAIYFSQEALYGTKWANRSMGDPKTRPALLLAPLIGGTVMGAAFFVLSLTGVLEIDSTENPPPPPGFVLMALTGAGFGLAAAVYLFTRKGRKPSRKLLWALTLTGMAFMAGAAAFLR
ncbi:MULTISPECIES: hypothetical protein [unclassified Arthrobacter]|uniref:hypothetical protein n=1 Tax=unclassified Arthrobacter TaxID=235627 RepID=UPI001D1551A9|nr:MULTISPECIES: hypothetical protein [unclassified Arthrobacter]MCC3274958.1 hypothetical protein [Arthrobacter sp. zg-Y20]MCC9177445.1 hypothetical protein [Arthrobacter sp. zg-Y750]MDK1315115.1 hypothetical protein [Arthrobacter sp. zg.Y20]WIB04960.1 hypothetical protein QNO06_10345 [Arthrobacter sp. zg-Y20]